MKVFTLNQDAWFGKKGQKFIKVKNNINKDMCWITKGGGLKTTTSIGTVKEICTFNHWGTFS